MSRKTWSDRDQYGIMLRALIAEEITLYTRASQAKKNNIASTIGYLVSIVSRVIKDDTKLEERILQLETRAGIINE
jgi:hypothetical protein